MVKLKPSAIRVGAVAVAVATVGVMTAGAAGAAPLPNGQKTVPAADGWSVVLKSTNNSFSIQPSLATAQTRTVWVSSKGSVDVKAPASAKDIQGKLGVGIVSGCQFPGAIGGSVGVSGPGVGAGLGTSGPSGTLSLGGASAGLDIPLSPGSTTSVTGYGRGDQPASLDSIKFSKAGTFTVSLQNYDLNYGNCSGYAQARIVTWVEIKGSNRIQGFLYGAPFSMG